MALEQAPASPPTRSGTRLRTLVVGGTGKPPEDEFRRLIAEDAMPDAVSAEAAINPTFLDDRLFAGLTGIRGWLVRHLPFKLAQLMELVLRAHDHDVVLTWSDQPGIMVAALGRIWPRRLAHVAILFWPSKPKKAVLLKLVQRSIDRLIVNPPLQRRFLQTRLGIPAERFVDATFPVDTTFWRPLESETDTICAVGQEMRDYATLLEALQPLDVPCHIAVGFGVFGRPDERWWRESLGASGPRPEKLTVGPKPFKELRELYARSRFVVVPLIPSDNDSGITTITEAMAMGKALIVTDTPGQVGILEDGVNCLRVPPHDAAALRAAITTLWADPERCERLGAAGRALMESQHNLGCWADALVRAVEGAHAARHGLRAPNPPAAGPPGSDMPVPGTPA